MVEVFISYKRELRSLVAPIAARLGELGVDVWFDFDLTSGERFAAVIHEKIKEAKAVLVCWSPEALESDWVTGEADYARDHRTYVPIFIAPCALMPPYNRIQTDDLSQWKGEASDPVWVRLVDRIAKLIEREGVAAAARAFAIGDEQARYDFAKRYPDEPIAQLIWNAAETRHRERFLVRMAEAKKAVEARISDERSALDARLRDMAPLLELWLADERRAAAKGPRPDPLCFIEQAERGEDPNLREEISALRQALAEAKSKEGELDKARAEVTRLSEDLATSKTREALKPISPGEEERLRDEIVNLKRAQVQANIEVAEFGAAKAGVADMSKRLVAMRTLLPAFIGLVAAGVFAGRTLQEHFDAVPLASLSDLRQEKETAVGRLETLRRESEGFKGQVGSLSASLASARDSLAAADKKQSETQAHEDSLAKQLDDVRTKADSLEKQLAAARMKSGPEALPDHASSTPPTGQTGRPITADQSGPWYLVLYSTDSESMANIWLVSAKQYCAAYRTNVQIITSRGVLKVAVGPYLSEHDALEALSAGNTCVNMNFAHTEKPK